MKFNLRITGLIIFFFLFLTLSIFSAADFVVVAANEQQLKEEASVSVSVNIPIFQRLEIIKEPNIDYSFLMDNYNGSKDIVVEDALTIEVLSNAKWHLRLNNRNLNSKVMIKKSSQSAYDWQNLNSTTAKFRGENGVQQITFDLKFVLARNSIAAADDLDLDLRYSLAPELY